MFLFDAKNSAFRPLYSGKKILTHIFFNLIDLQLISVFCHLLEAQTTTVFVCIDTFSFGLWR